MINPEYSQATERIEDLERRLRAARTIMSDFKLRDRKVAELKSKIADARAARAEIPMVAEQ